jgi:Na+-driven multidrug efflux pump
MFFFPEALAKIMLTGDEQIAIAAQYLPVSGIMLFAVDFLFVFRSGVQAMGRPFIPMISGIVEMAVRIVVTVSFISRTGFITTAYAEVLAWLAALLLNASAFVIYLRSKLEEKRGLNVEANTAINH